MENFYWKSRRSQESLHNWHRRAKLPILWRPILPIFPILPNPIFFKFCPTPPLSPQNPTPTVFSVVLFLWLNGLSRHIWCAILLNDNMDLQMSRLGTLVPEGPWCVFYATRRQVYWGLEHVVFNWYSNLISHAQTHKHTQNTQGTVD